MKPILVITDDLGTQYEGSGGASSGSDGFHSLSHNIWGPLNPNARALHVEVTRLLWRRYSRPNRATKSRHTYVDSIQEGPWRLTIPL